MAMPKTALPTALPTVWSRHAGLLAVPPNLCSHLPEMKYFLPGVYMVYSLLHSNLPKCHLRDVVFDVVLNQRSSFSPCFLNRIIHRQPRTLPFSL